MARSEVHLDEISHLDFDGDLKCDYTDCSSTATHRALCPVCPEWELFCTPHVDAIQRSHPDARGTFDKSCGHNVKNSDVRFLPL